jgi:hypothetical protein
MTDTARQTYLRYFETMVTFQSPDDAEEAAAALAEAGYAFEQTQYVFDEDDGILLTCLQGINRNISHIHWYS